MCVTMITITSLCTSYSLSYSTVYICLGISCLVGYHAVQQMGAVLSAAHSQLVAQFSIAGGVHNNDSLWSLSSSLNVYWAAELSSVRHQVRHQA